MRMEGKRAGSNVVVHEDFLPTMDERGPRPVGVLAATELADTAYRVKSTCGATVSGPGRCQPSSALARLSYSWVKTFRNPL